MTTIKKQFVEIHAILTDNKNKKVSTILADLEALMVSKTQQRTYRTNDDGNLEIFCYYHKQWEDVTVVEYGKKASTKTGLASMCKEGVSHWNKQQRDMKLAKNALLDNLAKGDITVQDLPELMEDIETASKIIVALES